MIDVAIIVKTVSKWWCKGPAGESYDERKTSKIKRREKRAIDELSMRRALLNSPRMSHHFDNGLLNWAHTGEKKKSHLRLYPYFSTGILPVRRKEWEFIKKERIKESGQEREREKYKKGGRL